MDIQIPSHSHPLSLRKGSYTTSFCCICRASIGRIPFYVCEDCKVYIHEKCVELPAVIDHPFHPQHPLHLLRNSGFFCNSCHKKFYDKPHFRCETCNFDLDFECALMPKIEPGGEKFIQHFSHQHPMSLCSQDQDKFFLCFACKIITSEVLYGCIPCKVFLHKSCSELPTPVLHTLHPQHALHLRLKYSFCSICNGKDYSFKFICAVCDFRMDVSCWMEYNRKKESHVLEKDCFICNKQHSDSISCVDSKYSLNQACIWMPEEINHQFHSHKPLQLLAPKDFWCDSCHQWFDANSCYGCHECNFHMNVACALMPMIRLNESEKYLCQTLPFYFRHQHPLCLITQDFRNICSVCQMSGPYTIYGCLRCEYFLHLSCIELPSEIESPLHGLHKLTLGYFRNSYCHLCFKEYSGFFFGCVKCKLYIGIECYLLDIVYYEYHDHPLCLVEDSNSKRCDARGTFCKISNLSEEFRLTERYSIRCIECNYNLHLLCGPLPCTIKSKNHLHTLTLMDYVVEDGCDDYYCDVCEEARDPRVRVFYCEYCDFVSHVHCLTFEILNALKKNSRRVKLRIMGDLNIHGQICQTRSNESGNVCNLKSLLNSLHKDDVKVLEDGFSRAKLYQDYIIDIDETEESVSNFKAEGNDIILEHSMYSDDIINTMLKRLGKFQLSRKYHIEPHEFELTVVDVNDYTITSNLGPLLSALFMKYGDFSDHTRFETQAKYVIFYLFCRMVNEMRTTCVADINEEMLYTWLYYFNAASRLDFTVTFVQPFLERAILSYSGLRVIKLDVELPDKVALEIAALEREIEKRKKFMLQYKSGMVVEKSKVMRESVDCARKHKWRPAGEGML